MKAYEASPPFPMPDPAPGNLPSVLSIRATNKQCDYINNSQLWKIYRENPDNRKERPMTILSGKCSEGSSGSAPNTVVAKPEPGVPR